MKHTCVHLRDGNLNFTKGDRGPVESHLKFRDVRESRCFPERFSGISGNKNLPMEPGIGILLPERLEWIFNALSLQPHCENGDKR